MAVLQSGYKKVLGQGGSGDITDLQNQVNTNTANIETNTQNLSNAITAYNEQLRDLVHEYHFTTNIQSTLNNTSANAANFQTIIGATLFNQIIADPERYRLSFQTEAGALDDNIAVGAVGYGFTAGSSKPNGNLFSITGGAQYSASKALSKLNPIYLQFMVQTDGSIYFNVEFNNAWNANFSIRRIHIEVFTADTNVVNENENR